MRILHQFKLMTSNGFGILLIPVERIKRDISKLEKVFNEPPVELEQQMNWYDEQGRDILKEPP